MLETNEKSQPVLINNIRTQYYKRATKAKIWLKQATKKGVCILRIQLQTYLSIKESPQKK